MKNVNLILFAFIYTALSISLSAQNDLINQQDYSNNIDRTDNLDYTSSIGQSDDDNVSSFSDRYIDQFEKTELLIVLRDDISDSAVANMLAEYRATEVWVSPLSKVRLWSFTSFGYYVGGDIINNINDAKKKMEKSDDSEIEEVGLNVNALMTAPKSRFEKISFLNDRGNSSIDENAYSIYSPPGDYTVRVAVFDTGYKKGKIKQTEDNQINIVHMHDYVNDDHVAEDDHGHGTHIASIIHNVSGQSSAIEFDIRKTHNNHGRGKLSDLIYAMDESIIAGADILNMSFSYIDNNILSPNHPFYRALDVAEKNNVLVVAASGNDGSSMSSTFRSYPATANFKNIISVASTDKFKKLSPFTNYSTDLVDVVAPGEDILGYSHKTGYFTKVSGTSQSTAVVSGMAALIGTHVDKKAITYKKIITDNVTPHQTDKVKYGAVDMLNMIRNLTSDLSIIKKRDKEETGVLSIAPNPFRENVGIDLTGISSGSIDIYNELGQLLSRREFVDNKGFLNINASELDGGQFIYIRIQSDNKQWVRKLYKIE